MAPFRRPSASDTYLTLQSQAARLQKCYAEIDFLRPLVLLAIISDRAHQPQSLIRTVSDELGELGCRLEEHAAVLRQLYVLQATLASYQLIRTLPPF